MTPQMRLRFEELYSAGVPWRQIESELGYSMAWLSRAAREMGLPRRNSYQMQWTLQGGSYRPWLFQKDELESLVGAGESDAEIAKKLGRTKDGVRHQRRKMGIPCDAGLERTIDNIVLECRAVGIITDFDRLLARELEIAAMIGIGHGRLMRIRAKHNKPRPVRPKKSQRFIVARRSARGRILPQVHDA